MVWDYAIVVGKAKATKDMILQSLGMGTIVGTAYQYGDHLAPMDDDPGQPNDKSSVVVVFSEIFPDHTIWEETRPTARDLALDELRRGASELVTKRRQKIAKKLKTSPDADLGCYFFLLQRFDVGIHFLISDCLSMDQEQYDPSKYHIAQVVQEVTFYSPRMRGRIETLVLAEARQKNSQKIQLVIGFLDPYRVDINRTMYGRLKPVSLYNRDHGKVLNDNEIKNLTLAQNGFVEIELSRGWWIIDLDIDDIGVHRMEVAL